MNERNTFARRMGRIQRSFREKMERNLGNFPTEIAFLKYIYIYIFLWPFPEEVFVGSPEDLIYPGAIEVNTRTKPEVKAMAT